MSVENFLAGREYFSPVEKLSCWSRISRPAENIFHRSRNFFVGREFIAGRELFYRSRIFFGGSRIDFGGGVISG